MPATVIGGHPISASVQVRVGRPIGENMPLNPIKKTSEAGFEAELRGAIKHAFPWLPDGSVINQKSFSFKFGHSTVTVDGKYRGKARARADILLTVNGAPLAIFELKKPGLTLTKEDDEQGLSYARVHHPRPPLVVVSNSQKVRFLVTDTGEEWDPEPGRSSAALKTLIDNAVKVAQGDLESAVATLMGSDPDVWVQALRHATTEELDERIGALGEPLKPFARDFLIPRRATQEVFALLETNRLVMLEGGPLSGKSNILRELCMHKASSEDCVLYVDADFDVDPFERIADILGDALDWRISPEQTKGWLRNLSKQEQPRLILTFDNVRPDRPDVRRAIETLTTNAFGLNLKIVVAVDDAVATQLSRSSNRRESSALGRRAARVTVGPMDRREFDAARSQLDALRITFAPGAQHSAELRAPWLVRAMVAATAMLPTYSDEMVAASISPVPGLELLTRASQRFDTSEHPFNLYREMARALLYDAMDVERAYQLKLELMDTFIIRRSTALEILHSHDISAMLSNGLIREARSQSNDNIFVIRLPELMAYELAIYVAEILGAKAQENPEEAAEWIVGFASSLPLGEVIATFAILEMASDNDWQDYGVISALRQMKPRQGRLSVGSTLATRIEGMGVAHMTVREDGSVLLRLPNGTEHEHDAIVYDEVGAFNILAHLAGHAFESDRHMPGSNEPTREDPGLLLDVGSTPFLLRRAGGNVEVNSVPVHDIGDDLTTVCHHAGVVEPITWSLVKFLTKERGRIRDRLIDDAIDRGELALLARIDIALRYMGRLANHEVSQWAVDTWENRINPAIDKRFPGFAHV